MARNKIQTMRKNKYKYQIWTCDKNSYDKLENIKVFMECNSISECASMLELSPAQVRYDLKYREPSKNHWIVKIVGDFRYQVVRIMNH